MEIKPNTEYSRPLGLAIVALAKDDFGEAILQANKSVHHALYKMMEPVSSVYVQQALEIRRLAFAGKRMSK